MYTYTFRSTPPTFPNILTKISSNLDTKVTCISVRRGHVLVDALRAMKCSSFSVKNQVTVSRFSNYPTICNMPTLIVYRLISLMSKEQMEVVQAENFGVCLQKELLSCVKGNQPSLCSVMIL